MRLNPAVTASMSAAALAVGCGNQEAQHPVEFPKSHAVVKFGERQTRINATASRAAIKFTCRLIENSERNRASSIQKASPLGNGYDKVRSPFVVVKDTKKKMEHLSSIAVYKHDDSSKIRGVEVDDETNVFDSAGIFIDPSDSYIDRYKLVQDENGKWVVSHSIYSRGKWSAHIAKDYLEAEKYIDDMQVIFDQSLPKNPDNSCS